MLLNQCSQIQDNLTPGSGCPDDCLIGLKILCNILRNYKRKWHKVNNILNDANLCTMASLKHSSSRMF